MKKILTIAAMIALSMQLAFAQSTLVKNVEKAKAATEDAKKATKVATWLNLGKAYWDAYEKPTASIPMGMSAAEMQILMSGEKPLSTENVNLGGTVYEKQVFKDKELYFAQGRLQMINVTKPALGKKVDALDGAFQAYSKAGELDVKGSKKKDIVTKISEIDKAYFNDAYTAFILGDKKKAAELFLKAGKVSASPYSERLDTSAFFNAGLAYVEEKDFEKARECYELALEKGYDKSSKGGIYASLANVAMELKDTVAAKKYLEDGFALYPDNPQILTDLINLYLWTKGNPEDIIKLLDKAKEQMPDNAGLYDVEGDIWKQLGNRDNAIAAYNKSLEVNPKGDYPYYALGRLYCDWYNVLEEEKSQIDLRDYKKYDEADKFSKETLSKSIEPLEKCFEVSTRKEMKLASADLLKKVYFQLRNIKPEYLELNKKYDEICKQLQAQ